MATIAIGDIHGSDALIWGPARFPTDTTVLSGSCVATGTMPSCLPAARRLLTSWGEPSALIRFSHGVLTAVRLPDQKVFQSAPFR